MAIVSGLFFAIVIILAVLMVALTLSLNTKSEGLGAAITGASDTYRGAVGVEEQKRYWLRTLGYSFLIVAFLYSVITPYI
jgi:protein translocase SecG subunit